MRTLRVRGAGDAAQPDVDNGDVDFVLRHALTCCPDIDGIADTAAKCKQAHTYLMQSTGIPHQVLDKYTPLVFNAIQVRISEISANVHLVIYNRTAHGVLKRDYKQLWTDYFAALVTQSNRLSYWSLGAGNHPDRPHYIYLLCLYLIAYTLHTFESPLTRCNHSSVF